MTVETARRGYALMTVLIIVLMAGGVLAALARVGTDIRNLEALRVETAAFALAEAGLEHYFAGVGQLAEDTTMVLPGGTARVRAVLIRPALIAGDTALYVIRSEGVVAGSDGRLQEGRRTVAQLANRNVGVAERESRWSRVPNTWVNNWPAW